MRFQCDGNLVFLKHDPATGQWPVKKIMNVSGNLGKNGNIFKKDELSMIMKRDGNLVVYYQKKSDCNEKFDPMCELTMRHLRELSSPPQAVWSSGTSGSFNNGTGRLEYQADGNLVIYSLK